MRSMTVAQLLDALATPTPPIVIDVRRREAYDEDTGLIAGALRRDPETVLQWSGELAKGNTVVVYCVHGHAVSQAVAQALAAQGQDACFLEGGYAAWQAGGGPCDGKPSGAAPPKARG